MWLVCCVWTGALLTANSTNSQLRECEKVIESVDSDGNGTIDWGEFREWTRGKLQGH